MRGGAFTLRVKSVIPSKASKAVTWKSSNKKIVTVTNKGRVRAKKSGTAVITATSKSNSKVKAKCKVKVYKATKRLVLSCADHYALNIGDTQNLSAKVTKPKSGAQPVFWRSKNEAVAKVDAKGRVIAVSVGQTAIVGKSGKKSVQVMITVASGASVPSPSPTPEPDPTPGPNPTPEPPTPENPTPGPEPGGDVVEVEEIRASISGTILEVGGTAQITASVLPENATDKTLRYASSNPAAASVTETGLIRGVSSGSSELTVSSVNGKTASFVVTVINGQGEGDLIPVTGVSLSHTELTLEVGGTAALTASVLPENATNKMLNWASEDPETVSVTQEGLLTGHRVGNARIRAWAWNGADGSVAEAYCQVAVREKKEDEGEETYTVYYSNTMNGALEKAEYPCSELPVLPDEGQWKSGCAFKGWNYLSELADKEERIPYDPKTFVPEKGKTYFFETEWEKKGIIDSVMAKKLAYYVGDRIDPAHIWVQICVGERLETASPSDLAYDPEIVTTPGEFIFNIIYKPTGSTAVCAINGVEVVPTELTAAYHGAGRAGEALKNEDFTVTVLYNNKKTEEVKDFVIVSPKALKEGESIVELLYEDVTATCTVLGVSD